ncbi:hypothetical protein Lalb_Chr05g0228341 [Lupinus albus]|uniref:Uncharacterized protein n=1 Tax=Lupinus albus TaxID=3870 RepID=A0A6A4QJ34_LUPAL|nr:hypothetical protein Lalb_Chr05g0228341 [Lupinus albus]
MGYRGVEEKILEQSETPSPSSAVVDLDVLWVDARKNKQGVIDNEKVQEVVNRVVTLKERESFRTADSQVLLEKALGLPQYPGRIRGAGFGASKLFVIPYAKRLTKADAAVLHDKYDSLAEKFHAMEKRMEAGKFVEGPEASTVVEESFTHPRNHIPIPEDTIIHHAQIPSNHLNVSIDISIEDDALLPIPVYEDIIIVGLALATFVV